VLTGVAVLSGSWLFIAIAAVVTIACVLAAIPIGAGEAIPRSELDRFEERLRETHRSLDAN
jgi:hypothetical protein